MKIALTTLILIVFVSINAIANERDKFISDRWPISKTQQKDLNNFEILADANVNTQKKDLQTFDMKVMALHKRKCRKALRVISMLENYKEWISFIIRSDYNQKSKLFTLKADHPVLPTPMIIHIIVDRPKKQGRYNFSFPTGMFTGLAGYFEIKEFNNQCHFYATSHWKGKKTKIPDFIIEIFAETLSKIGGQMLMRKS